MQARFQGDTQFEFVIRGEQRIAGVRIVRPGRFCGGGAELRTSECELADPLAVDAELDLVRNIQAPDQPGIGLVKPRLQQVFAVNREVMARRDAAARAERKLFAQPVGLPQPRPLVRVVSDRRVAFECRPQCRIAECETRDLRRCGEVPIEQGGHNRQRIGVGVKAMRLLVRRKKKRAVHLHSEQIAHRVRIFGAIEAMQICRAARIRIRGSRTIELSLEPACDGVVGRIVGAPDARRRHRPGPQLEDDLLPRLRRAGDMVGGGRIEHEGAGFQLRVVTGNAIRRHELARRRSCNGS